VAGVAELRGNPMSFAGEARPRPGHGHRLRAPRGRCSGPLCPSRSPAVPPPSWWYLLDIAEQVPLRLWLVIHQEQPARAQLRVLDGYPVRWHLPSPRDRPPLRLPSSWGVRRDRLTCHS
jgi:hypothetical protein